MWRGAPPSTKNMREVGAQDQKTRREMEKLVSDGAFLSAENEEVLISPVFTIPKKSGGVRVIHDLRLINEHIRAPHFTLHGARDAGNVVRNSEYICTLDLERGY